MAVKYIGAGSAIAGIPGRDLSDDEIIKYVVPVLANLKIKEKPDSWLESTGLYLATKKSKKAGE